MNYLEWVERVAHAYAQIEHGTDRLVGLREVMSQLGVADKEEDAVWTALTDLEMLGIVTIDSVHWIKPTQNTRAVRSGASLRELWPAFVRQFLDEEQTLFLEALVELSERQSEAVADVEWVQVDEVYSRLGWSTALIDPYSLTESLASVGLVRRDARTGGYIAIHPTYAGVVRATQRTTTEWGERIERLVAEWETTSVEFKRQLELKTSVQKAEFAKDVLALANTKASGSERLLIVGFDDQTRVFAHPWDPAVRQEHLEQILDAYTTPMPNIRLTTFEHESGTGLVGVISVYREPERIPYGLTKAAGKLGMGDVFVRHGSHVVRPDDDEREDLWSEGRSARGESV